MTFIVFEPIDFSINLLDLKMLVVIQKMAVVNQTAPKRALAMNITSVSLSSSPLVNNIGKQVVGMVVDGVSDVITFTLELQRPVPEFSSSIGSDHLLAIGSIQNRLLILLDIEKLMSSTEMGLISTTLQ